jgi:dTDP-4-amino-4,6-dideoxygalactose transaminase
VLAAFLYAQLEVWKNIQVRRREIWERYHAGLAAWCAANGVRQPVVPGHCQQAWHMYYLLLPSLPARSALIEHLKRRGILAVFHYLPLHLSEYAKQRGGKKGQLPVVEDISDRLLRLPFYNSMTDAEQAHVIKEILNFSC